MRRFFSNKTSSSLLSDCKKVVLEKGSKLIGHQNNLESQLKTGVPVQLENATSFMHYLTESSDNPVVRSTLEVTGRYWMGTNKAGRHVFFVQPKDFKIDSILTPQQDQETSKKNLP